MLCETAKEKAGSTIPKRRLYNEKRQKVAGSIPARPTHTAMKYKKIMEEVAGLCTPTKAEQARVEKIVKEVEMKVNAALKKLKLSAKCLIGGSVAKGTWLPGVSDIDFFILFNYDKYKSQTSNLSDIAGRAIKLVFKKVERLHGSRDYFNVSYDNLILEFVPVLAISWLSDALNLTDYSPLHVYWVCDRLKANRKLQTEVRLAKQFFKAAGVYGAESYITGFSGHAVEILTIYYGSFMKLLQNAAEWKHGDVIDVNRTYKNKNKIFSLINASKLQSPIIVIDPVEPTRNAAAALGDEKFGQLKKFAKKFLANPSANFFKVKQFNIESLQFKGEPNYDLFVLQAKPAHGKTDVVGCKLLKLFETLKREIKNHDFLILNSNWYWPGEGKAVFWFYLPAKLLPKEKIIIGPPAKIQEKFIKQFKKKWKRVYLKGGRYYAKAKRETVAADMLIKKLAKQYKLLTLKS